MLRLLLGHVRGPITGKDACTAVIWKKKQSPIKKKKVHKKQSASLSATNNLHKKQSATFHYDFRCDYKVVK